AARIVLRVDQDDGVGVELDVAAVLAPRRALGAHDDGPHDRLLFQLAAGDDRLDAANNDVSQARRAAFAAAEDLDAHHFASAGVISDRHAGFLLDHAAPSFFDWLYCGAVDFRNLRPRQIGRASCRERG